MHTQEAADLAAARESAWLAPFAMHSIDTKGRRYAEPSHAYRGPYQRDRDRIVHCSAFRRLSHKTQVFTGDMGDYHRTRLTHTLEVASIARTIARALRLNEDLVESLALAHDLGHPPFGHSGEEVLDRCLDTHGGFNHNAQALRVCEVHESRYPEFPGLNLSLEVLEGQQVRANKASENEASSPLLEVQIVDAADSIAYDAHDADDALELGILELRQLLELPLWREAAARVRRRFAAMGDRQLRRAIVHEVIDWQVGDVLGVVERHVAEQEISSVDDVRRSPHLAHSSTELSEMKLELERFLFNAVYRHPDVLAVRTAAQRALAEMFDLLVADVSRLPPKFQRFAQQFGEPRAVADYLAGMTDRFALEEHRRLTASLSHCGPPAG